MNGGIQELTTKELLFKLFFKALDLQTLFAATILLFCSLFIFKHGVFKIVLLFAFFVLFVVFINLASSPVFIQYILAIPQLGIVKVYAIQLAGMIKNIGRPSKSMPGITAGQVKLVEFVGKNIFITKYYFKYAKRLQAKLLNIAKIYIFILMLPDRELKIHYPKVDEAHRIVKGLA